MAAPLAVVAGVPAGTVAAVAAGMPAGIAAGPGHTGVADDSLPLAELFGLCYITVA